MAVTRVACVLRLRSVSRPQGKAAPAARSFTECCFVSCGSIPARFPHSLHPTAPRSSPFRSSRSPTASSSPWCSATTTREGRPCGPSSRRQGNVLLLTNHTVNLPSHDAFQSHTWSQGRLKGHTVVGPKRVRSLTHSLSLSLSFSLAPLAATPAASASPSATCTAR